jgi:hypothetical protein
VFWMTTDVGAAGADGTTTTVDCWFDDFATFTPNHPQRKMPMQQTIHGLNKKIRKTMIPKMIQRSIENMNKQVRSYRIWTSKVNNNQDICLTYSLVVR